MRAETQGAGSATCWRLQSRTRIARWKPLQSKGCTGRAPHPANSTPVTVTGSPAGLVIHLLLEDILVALNFGQSTNRSATNICVHVCVGHKFSVHLGKWPGAWLLDRRVRPWLALQETAKCLPKRLQLLHSHWHWMRAPVTPDPHQPKMVLSALSSNRCVLVSHCCYNPREFFLKHTVQLPKGKSTNKLHDKLPGFSP